MNIKSKKTIEKYKKTITKTINNIDSSLIYNMIDALEQCHDSNSTVYIIGNGGSAATASHMATDLSVGLSLRDIRHFNVKSLSDNSAVSTAISNDVGYENIFYAQLVNRLEKGDLVIAISCSGNSENTIKAAKYCREVGSTLVSMTGFDGGELKKLADISFHVETEFGEYGLVEDIHMILNHMIYSHYVSEKPENKNKYIIGD